jgi:hypothetical protein
MYYSTEQSARDFAYIVLTVYLPQLKNAIIDSKDNENVVKLLQNRYDELEKQCLYFLEDDE